MEQKENKKAFLQIRIQKELKENFQAAIRENGDTVSGFFTRTIIKYLNEHKR